MRGLGSFAAIALVLVLGGAAGAVEQGDVAPAFRAQSFTGDTVEFPALIDGKPTVVVFWATWCNYCKAFMPYVEDIQADYGTDAINVLTINAKEDGTGDPAAYIDELGFDTIAVADGDRIARAYDVEYIPGLMIVGTNGRVAWRREWTDLPAGRRVAELWDGQVRDALDRLLR